MAMGDGIGRGYYGCGMGGVGACGVGGYLRSYVVNVLRDVRQIAASNGRNLFELIR